MGGKKPSTCAAALQPRAPSPWPPLFPMHSMLACSFKDLWRLPNASSCSHCDKKTFGMCGNSFVCPFDQKTKRFLKSPCSLHLAGSPNFWSGSGHKRGNQRRRLSQLLEDEHMLGPQLALSSRREGTKGIRQPACLLHTIRATDWFIKPTQQLHRCIWNRSPILHGRFML